MERLAAFLWHLEIKLLYTVKARRHGEHWLCLNAYSALLALAS